MATVITDINPYGEKIVAELKSRGVRVEGDFRNEKITYKVREHSLQKIPYIVALGAREAEQNTVTIPHLRQR